MSILVPQQCYNFDLETSLLWIDRVKAVLERYEQVELAYIFGSRLKETAGPTSDLDLAVSISGLEPVDALLAELAHDIHKELPEMGEVDLIDLSRSPLELNYSIIASGYCIYYKEYAPRVEFEANVLSRYCDYLPVLRQQRRDILSEEGYERRIQRYRKALERTQRTLGEALSASKQESGGV